MASMATKEEILEAVGALTETLDEVANVQDEINERLEAIEAELGIGEEPEEEVIDDDDEDDCSGNCHCRDA